MPFVNLDYSFAKKLELESHFKFSNLSFADCLHIAICKRNNFILISRDFELLNYAKKIGLSSGVPEEYI